MGATYRSGRPVQKYNDFGGGVQDFTSPLWTNDNETPFGKDCDITPGDVISGNRKRVHGLLSGMGIDLDFEQVEKTITAQEGICKEESGTSYNFFRLMEAVVKELNLPLGNEEAACLAGAYAGPRYAAWLFPGTEETLRTLKNSGCRMGIIANTAWPGFCMDRAFAGVGLLPFFDIRIYSGDIGIEKPDPEIFQLAEKLAGLKGGGKRILYVGNDLNADIKGASEAGWSTAFRRGTISTTDGLADMEFDHISELVDYCLPR